MDKCCLKNHPRKFEGSGAIAPGGRSPVGSFRFILWGTGLYEGALIIEWGLGYTTLKKYDSTSTTRGALLLNWMKGRRLR